MDVREKLVELLERAFESFIDDPYCIPDERGFADHLIANGVTFAKDINAPIKWISVKDRLPQENERVLACYINPLRKDRSPRMMVGEGTSTQIVKGKVYLWCGGWRSITHWMPLPQPPKGE